MTAICGPCGQPIDPHCAQKHNGWPFPTCVPAGPVETQATINSWVEETFPDPTTDIRVAVRAQEELTELLQALTTGQPPEKALAECADVVIVLYRLAQRLGGDLHEAIDTKMAINRTRKWETDGTGCSYHIKDGEQ